MNPTLQVVLGYFGRVAPGLALGAAMLVLTRRNAPARIPIYLALFVLLRDAMTPLGLWSFGSQGFFWIRLHNDPWFLIASAVSSLAIVLAVYSLDTENQALFRWKRVTAPIGLLWGIGGMFLVVAPLAVVYQFTPIESRGGTVPLHVLPALLVFALAGNLMEESLFRGYVLGQLEQTMSLMAAGVASGVVFAFCHIFLALTVTDIGYPLLLFTLWEGVIAGAVGARCGVLFSTITHGGAIFLLASGLF
jgi:membrane protease YdiL (CAAX protease family)